VRLSVPRASGRRARGAVRDEFERKLAGQESAAVALHADSEVRRGRDYVRVVVVATVDGDDVAEALDRAWRAFRKAAGEDLAGWDLAGAAAEVRPEARWQPRYCCAVICAAMTRQGIVMPRPSSPSRGVTQMTTPNQRARMSQPLVATSTPESSSRHSSQNASGATMPARAATPGRFAASLRTAIAFSAEVSVSTIQSHADVTSAPSTSSRQRPGAGRRAVQAGHPPGPCSAASPAQAPGLEQGA